MAPLIAPIVPMASSALLLSTAKSATLPLMGKVLLRRAHAVAHQGQMVCPRCLMLT